MVLKRRYRDVFMSLKSRVLRFRINGVLMNEKRNVLIVKMIVVREFGTYYYRKRNIFFKKNLHVSMKWFNFAAEYIIKERK